MTPTIEEIEAAKTERGGWTRETLAQWGVPWPPPKGWRTKLLEQTDAAMIEPPKRKRGRPRGSVSAKPKQTCVRGHELSGSNLVMISKGAGSGRFARGCRACRELHRERSRDFARTLSPRELRERAVLEQRVAALVVTLQKAIDLEVLRGSEGEIVARQALGRLIADGYIESQPAE